MARRLSELASLVGGRVEGLDVEVRGLAPLSSASPEDLSFVISRKYLKEAQRSQAGALIVPESLVKELSDRSLIVVKDPYLAYARLAQLFFAKPYEPRGISSQAVIGDGCLIPEDVSIYPLAVLAEGVRLGRRVTIFPGAYLGKGVEVGDDSVIHANVVIYPGCRIGRRVVIHAGAIIGADGFGYAREGEKFVKIPQVGTVIIEDEVEIGANTTIDRAAFGATVIGQGTKIDNLCQIAHNVRIGPHTAMAGLVGIAGSTVIGRGVMFGGGAGVADHVRIGDRAVIAARSGIHKDVPSGAVVSGAPAMEHQYWLRTMAALGRLPELVREVRRLKERLKRLEEGRDDDD
ncbi:UDP-3-O-(3-hydroxymyristoyl)glucosamine N-acyltransferase [Thermosulfuriphilus sp.]